MGIYVLLLLKTIGVFMDKHFLNHGTHVLADVYNDYLAKNQSAFYENEKYHYSKCSLHSISGLFPNQQTLCRYLQK